MQVILKGVCVYTHFLLLNILHLLPIMSSPDIIHQASKSSFSSFLSLLWWRQAVEACGHNLHIKGFLAFQAEKCALNYSSGEINLPQYKQNSFILSLLSFYVYTLVSKRCFHLSDVQSSTPWLFSPPLSLLSKSPSLPPFQQLKAPLINTFYIYDDSNNYL